MVRERLLMDFEWRFHLGDFPMPPAHAGWMKGGNFNFPPISRDFDDHAWRVVNLPHDFMVEGDFARTLSTDHDGHNIPNVANLYTIHGSLPGGVGWYRKRFELSEADRGRRLTLAFDGVFRNCSVWLNHHFLGRHLSGYTGFRFDITDIADEVNTLVVRTDATEYEGWFYEGGGIYRHVWLSKHDPVHFAPDEVFVSADVLGGSDSPDAEITVRTVLRNDTDHEAAARLALTIADPAGRFVANGAWDAVIPAGDETVIAPRLHVAKALLWSVDTPRLYTLTATLTREGREADEVRVPFGIRSFRFDHDKGFFLNGRPLKLKGACCHQDHAGLGVALPDCVHEFRIRALKRMGCNAYRCSHHPPAPELLDVCDRLGLLVMDENRLLGSSPEVLGQLEAMVRRDRNHPSIILWSLANEEHLQATESGARMAATMRRRAHRLDPTRPVTLAMNSAWDWGKGVSRSVDVQGCNYNIGEMDAFHKSFPAIPIVYTESAGTAGTRGIYADDPLKGYVRAYDVNTLNWCSTAEENWRHCLERPFVAGTFIWTGFDYRGEPSPYGWPCISSHFGVLDTCGFPKDNFCYYQAWWGDRPVLRLLPHWNWPGREGERIPVCVHSNCDVVELFLNGRSLGRKRVRTARHLEWNVVYRPGTLLARGFRKGRVVLSARVQTAGPAAAIRLAPDRPTLNADGEDTALVRVEIVDTRGRIVPIADNDVAFKLNSGGRILGVGNGDPSSHEPDKAERRRAFNGLCQVIVQAGVGHSPIILEATSPGLKSARLALKVTPGVRRPHVPTLEVYPQPVFECSDRLPAVADIRRAQAPGRRIIFAPIATAPNGFCDIRERHGGKHGLCYIRATFQSPRAGVARLRYGADGPVKVWVNGKPADCHPEATNPAGDGKYEIATAWRQGDNQVIFAFNTNHGRAWGVYCRPGMPE